MLSKTESPGVANIETDVQRYNQTGSELRVRNINGRAMLPDSTVNILDRFEVDFQVRIVKGGGIYNTCTFCCV